MENKKNILEELKKEAPFLSTMKKENHFAIPKNYLEELPEVICGTNMNNKKLTFNKLAYRILIPVFSFILIFSSLFIWRNNTSQKELTTQELSELIIDENYIELDDYLVYDAYAEVLEEQSNTIKNSLVDVESNLNTEEYIEYLIENDIDINSIIEEL